jgi:DNA mismatch repair protein MutS2
LLVGLPAESRALAIARRLGLDERVLARAAERLERRDAELSRLLEDVRAARRETDLARTRLDRSLAEAGEQQRQIAAERDALAQARSLAEREAQRMVEERVRDARVGLERMRALLGQVGPAARVPLEQALAELERVLSGAAQSEQRRSFLAALKKGDLVWVPRFARRLYVLRVDAKRAELLLRLGQQEVRVAYDEVTAYEGL